MATEYTEFVQDLKELCDKRGLTFGGGGSTETGVFKFGFRPKQGDDVESRDYMHRGLIQFRQLANDDPFPEFNLAGVA